MTYNENARKLTLTAKLTVSISKMAYSIDFNPDTRQNALNNFQSF